MALTLSSSPTVEPVSLDEAKRHLNITTSDDNGYIEGLIKVARRYVETRQRRQHITATWVLRCDRFPSVIEPPRPPLQSVTTLAYNDTAGAEQTLTEDTDFEVDIYSEPGRIYPVYGEDWPSTRGHKHDVTLTYVAGYGATASTVPEDIRHAIKLMVAHLYEMREPVITGTIVTSVPKTLLALIDQYRVGL